MTKAVDTEVRWSNLMRAAQDGDRRAYEELLRELVPFIRSLANHRHTSPGQTEDVVQDVLLTMHRVRHTYDPRRPFKPWLATIADRRCVDLYRRRSHTARHETKNEVAYETFADPGANREMEVHAEKDGVKAAIAGLPRHQREAVEMLKLKELTLSEAAQVSGQSVAALKVNMHRAVKSLRARLKKD